MSCDLLVISPANSIHAHRWIEQFQDIKFKWITFNEPGNIYDSLNIIQKNNLFHLVKSKFLLKKYLPIFFTLFFYFKLKPKKIHIQSIHKYAFYSILLFFFHKDIVITIWGSDFNLNKSNFLKKIIFKFIFKKAKLITTDGIHIKNSIENFIKNISNKIEIINFGLDTFYKDKHIDIEQVSKKIIEICSTEKKIILSSRGYEYYYGYLDLIKAANELSKKTDSNFLLILCGYPGSVNYKKLILKKIKQYNLTGAIKLLGPLNKYDLKYLVLNSYVYVSASRSDAGIASSICECMSQSIPVIAEDNSDNRLWVKNGINGFIYDKNNPGDLSAKIVEIKNLNKLNLLKFNNNILKEKNDIIYEMKKFKNLLSLG